MQKIAQCETHRELESQRLEQHQANQWADQAQREKIKLCGELEMRNGLRHECQTRTSQEIEELRRISHEKSNQVRKLKKSPRQEREESYCCESIAA